MDIVVSGSSGFIGTALVAALRGAGHRAIPLVRRAGVVDSLQWDPQVGQIDAAGFEGVDAVVHLAGEGIGEKKWSPAQKQRILESRTGGTALIATTLAKLQNGPQTLVSASAIGIYGNRGDEVLTEASTPGGGFLADVVVQWEAAAQPAVDAGVRVTFPRTGIVLSPNGGALARLLLPFKLGIGGRIASGRQYMSWISLDDEVRALLALLQNDAYRGPVNLTAPNPVTNNEFTKTLGSVLHRPTLLPTPLFPLKAKFGAELVEQLLVYSQRVEPAVLAANGFSFAHSTLEAALRFELQ
ncbi:MAG: TIGR01777 family oxidoreductase [Acidimicrobiia bacterium]